jgi:subtilisin family serine protease
MRLFYTLILVFSFLQTPFFVAAQQANPEKIAKKLLDKMAEAPDAYHSVHIVLTEGVDLEALEAQLVAQRALPEQRAEAVIIALKSKANETQGSLLTLLRNSPMAMPGSVTSFWIANALAGELRSELIAELSQRPDIKWIGINAEPQLEAYTVNPAPPVAPPNGREIGLSVIGAPNMWAMGYTGYGQNALTNDTGVDPSQPALSANYRGNMVPAEQAFFDYSAQNQAQIPNVDAFDCQYHGTHVNGTIVGLDRLANDTIGVAFNAQWMGAASIVCNGGTSHLLATFQWSMDPDGNPATSDDMADVVNNSWYDPGLDTIDCFSVYVPVLEAMEVAGVAVVFSAGNAGPGPATITPPHNVNLNLVNSFTVGALNGNSTSLPIADFSSRGPSHCATTDSSLLIKPEVSAPGVNVRSCLPTGYGQLSGTSMAAPHVSGAILLLKEAFPYLTGKDLKLALYFTAIDLGVPGEDNVFGMGVINLPAAFDYLVAQGNVPVSPHVEHDVFIVDLKMPAVTCESAVDPMILTVENGGSNPLTSFEVQYKAGNDSYTIGWVGNLAQGGRTTIQLPTLVATPGKYRFRVTLLKPNGVADERPLNNIIEKKLEILSRKRLQVQPEGAAIACEGASVLLRAEYDGPGYATVKWYDKPFGGVPVGEGMVFTTQPLAVADTFYAEASYTLPLGLKDQNTAPSEVLEDEEVGLVFDAHSPFKLISVKVFAESTGLRQFLLLDDDGDELEHTVVNINKVGEFEVPLNWDVPAIKGMQLIKNGGKGLFCNTADVSYPMVQAGLATIKGTTTSLADAYYFFYDWQLEIPEVCERTKTIIPVTTAGSSPGASFTVSADSIDLTSNQPVNFTNTSTDNVASFDWNFGDGTGSSLESPSHVYTVPGIYIVSLAITSIDGCTSFALDTIQVTNKGVSGTDPGRVLPENIAVYPNPTSQVVNVQLDLHSAKMVELQLTDMTGKPVRSQTSLASQKDLLTLDIADLATGVYFMVVKMEGGSSVWKVVKL